MVKMQTVKLQAVKRQIRPLSNEEVEWVYNNHLVKDFPAGEVKSLKRIADGIQCGKYEVYGYMEEELLAYAYIIKSSVSNTYLLDYFAVVEGKRSAGVGSEYLEKIMKMIELKGGHMILEVENPQYEPDGPHRDYMFRRIKFYEKNGLRLSGVSCNFCNNEYRVLYAGPLDLDDEQVLAETMTIYNDFFGEDFIKNRCHFHSN